MILRKYVPADCNNLYQLFYDTVHSINAKDYNKQQLDVWATGTVNFEEWNRSFLEHFTIVAAEGDLIVGFGDIDCTGYLDRLFVHKDYQGKGIATAICDELEKQCSGIQITTDASITAKPFFEKKGYTVANEQEVERQGIKLKNYVMKKLIIIENTPLLETNRLILRKFAQSDLLAYFDIMRDENANKYLPWFTVTTMEEANALMHKNCLDMYEKSSGYRYAVCLKENNIPIGYCGFSGTDSNDIGYGLKADFWHRGIITEATTAMVERIKNAGYLFITATHDISNPRSGEVMKKLGMSYKYSYVEKWQPKDIFVTFRMYQLNFDGQEERIYRGYWDKYSNHFVEEVGDCQEHNWGSPWVQRL